jgi:hypothetical protein
MKAFAARPTGRENILGMLSQGCRALALGYFRVFPPGGRGGRAGAYLERTTFDNDNRSCDCPA